MHEGIRHIAVVTVGRSDFSILRPLSEALDAAADFSLLLWVGGAHFDATGGMTLRDIEASGLPINAKIVAKEFGHTPAGMAAAMADQLRGFAEVAAKSITAGQRPDIVLVLGDRFEAVAAGLAMVPLGLPVGHISGGSITEGAMDDMFRHALTKLAALHICDVPEFARRINQMGEEPWRILTTGALGLDGVGRTPPSPLNEMAANFGLTGLRPGYVLSTLHTETMKPDLSGAMAKAMVAALAKSGHQVVYTYPNADAGSQEIIAAIEEAAAIHAGHYVVRNFGSKWFYSAMAHAGMVVGNSSSGIYEAASFALPVVDIGGRQHGRLRGGNVIHAEPDSAAILSAMYEARALAPTLDPTANIYGDGQATQRVIAGLRTLDWNLIRQPKRFVQPDPIFTGERGPTR